MLNKTHNIDCVQGLQKLKDNSVNLTVTSPPYDNLRTYTNESQWDFDVFKKTANELYRTTTDNGVVAWVIGDAVIKGSESGSSFKQAKYFQDIGFRLFDVFIYEKNSSSFPVRRDGNRYSQVFEYIFVFSKGNNTYNPLLKSNIKDKNKVIYSGNLKDDIRKTWDCDIIDIKNLPKEPEKGFTVAIQSMPRDSLDIPQIAKDNGYFLHDTMIVTDDNIYDFVFILSYKMKPKFADLLCDKPNRWAGCERFGKGSLRTKDGVLKERSLNPVPDFSPRFNIWRYKDTDVSTIWKYNCGKNYSTKDKVAYEHPAIFPELLCEDIIKVFSLEGDVVLDPFMGSGTTAKMAKKNNRDYIGFEISKEYTDIIKRRVK